MTEKRVFEGEVRRFLEEPFMRLWQGFNEHYQMNVYTTADNWLNTLNEKKVRITVEVLEDEQ